MVTDGQKQAGPTRAEVGDATKERLMRAAEQLISVRGVDAVSVQDITTEAKASISAIHYHFGSKDHLINETVARGETRLESSWSRILAELTADRALDPHTVVRAIVSTTAELANGPGRSFLGFLLALSNHPRYVPLIVKAADAIRHDMLAVIALVTPHLDEEERVVRYAMARELINRVLMPDGSTHVWINTIRPASHLRSLEELLVEPLVGLFSAPATRPA